MKNLIVVSCLLFVVIPAVAALSGQDIVDKAGEFTSGIEQKLDSAKTVQKIEENLPSKEETKGILRSVAQFFFIIIKFVAKIFDWALEVLTSAIYLILDRVGLGFFKN